MQHEISRVSRYHMLDILRGLAAFAILVWHYQHFFTLNETRGAYPVSSQPFYFILSPFYKYGHIAVYLFFSLSGFVFFSTYADKLQQQSVSFSTFMRNRISRLYPLHLLTLLLTAFLQFIYVRNYGSYFIYGNIDLKHFLLNLFFISHWGFENGHSFNGPIWSVSIEMLLYLIFFLFLSCTKNGNGKIMLIAFTGLIYAKIFNPQIGVAIWSFFTGGLIYYLCNSLLQTSRISSKTKLLMLAGLNICCFSAYIAATYFLDKKELILLSTATISPALIFTLAYWQHQRPQAGSRFNLIGDLTYSSYLIHFPVQIIIQICRQEFGIFYPENILTFIAYTSLTYILSYFLYFKFELPAKLLLRNK